MTLLFGRELSDSGSLVWANPAWVLGLVVIAVVVALLVALRPVVAERVPELILAGTGALALVVAAAGPTWVEEGDRLEPGRLVVLVDGSRSMDVKDRDGKPRSVRVADLLERIGPAEVWSFGDALKSGPPSVFDGGQSDVGGALGAISQRYAGEKLSGIVLVTDGLDRGGLRRRLAAGEAAGLSRLGGPLTVYQVGRDEDRPDLAVTDIESGAFAFLRTPTSIVVNVRARGLATVSTPVTLTRDGQPVGTKTAQLDTNGEGRVAFEITPDAVGRYNFEASVPVPDGDAVPSNNTMTRAVRVVRDHVRVLQVCGAPSWDQKFLRLFLKEDPGVDLVSFFILRTQEDFGSGYRPSELSLIQFPYERLFSTDLGSFDLVILQNFDYAPYFDSNADQLLENMAKYVENGGALAMIGGDRSFDLGGYANTALARVLPVKLGATGDAVNLAPFRPTLTTEGVRHPVTALSGDTQENARLWTQLAEMDGTNLDLGPASGAAVLLEHPSQMAGNRAMPVLAVAERGAGRTLALTVDASWRWSFDEAGAGRGNQAYLRFWKNAMRWLVGDPEDQPVTVDTSRENYPLGDEVKIVVRVRDVGFAPVAGAKVKAAISGPGGSRELGGVSGPDGNVLLTMKAETRGAWRVKAEAISAEGGALGRAQTVFAVTTRDPELEEIQPDAAFLRALASSAGGKFVGPDGYEPPLLDPSAGRTVGDRRETKLWTNPVLPAVFALAFSGSWALRRRRGFR